MTLLICVFAAIIATVKWYQRKDDSLMLGVPCVLFWGASLMWLGDAPVRGRARSDSLANHSAHQGSQGHRQGRTPEKSREVNSSSISNIIDG